MTTEMNGLKVFISNASNKTEHLFVSGIINAKECILPSAM